MSYLILVKSTTSLGSDRPWKYVTVEDKPMNSTNVVGAVGLGGLLIVGSLLVVSEGDLEEARATPRATVTVSTTETAQPTATPTVTKTPKPAPTVTVTKTARAEPTRASRSLVRQPKGSEYARAQAWARGSKAWAVAGCESGHNPRATNGTHWGIWQFDAGTWISNTGGRYASRADGATTAEQNHIAYRTWLRRGWQPWACA